MKLWYYICFNVNPSTTTGASGFKEDIETAILSDFGNDVKAFNTWFCDKRDAIIKEEGEGKYNKYTRSIFRTYLMAENEEFVDTIKSEKREWTLGKKPTTYTHKDVLKLATTTFNNISAEKAWKKGPKKDEKDKFLALLAKLVELKKSINTNATNNAQAQNGNRNSSTVS